MEEKEEEWIERDEEGKGKKRKKKEGEPEAKIRALASLMHMYTSSSTGWWSEARGWSDR